LAAVLVLSAGAAGCNAKIGDDCEVSANCSATGDRLCDVTQPGGYCTIFNCEPGTCPDEAVCIGFSNVVSPAKACSDLQGGQRLQRTFCMRRCDSSSDCRAGYTCEDMGNPENEWGAIVVEGRGTSGKVCAVPFRGRQIASNPDDVGVCTGGWDGGGQSTVPDAAPGADATAGADAAPDAGAVDASFEPDATAQDAAHEASSDSAAVNDAEQDVSAD
jgi:hypothetical protein